MEDRKAAGQPVVQRVDLVAKRGHGILARAEGVALQFDDDAVGAVLAALVNLDLL